ncbi:MAG: hypothetical protein JNM84_09650 [Planctomycetes bacterium]|nr:hypothetical protein [Planctomycetota bacterium]
MRLALRFANLLALGGLAALALAMRPAPPQEPAPPTPTPAPKIRESNRVAAEVRFEYADEHSEKIGEGTITFTSQRSGSAWAELRRYRAYAGVDSFEWTRPAQGLIRIDDRIVTAVGGGEVVQTENGTGLPQDCTIGLHIDPAARTYSFSFDIATKTRTELRGPLGEPERGESQGGFAYESPDLPLPSEGTLLEGETSFAPLHADGRLGTHLVEIGKTLRMQAGKPMTPVRVRWRFGRPDPLPPLELVLRAENHAGWLPEGPLPPAPEGTVGNRITVVAELRSKDGSALPRGAVAMSFELLSVSTEPGYALNHPLEAAHDPRAFDLGFVEGGDAAPLVPRAQAATTPIGDWKLAHAEVGAFDWGAHGALRAKAYVAHHGELVAVLEGSEERELRLPQRAASSAVADAWKKSYGVADRTDDDDAERTSGNEHDGDGLTLYEEYRGFFGRGRHSRHDALCALDPRRKDLIVLIGERGSEIDGAALRPLAPRLADARRAFALFESASRGIRSAELLQSEVPESRCLNANHRSAHRGLQHGVLLFDSGPMPDGGETSEGSTVGGAYPLALQRKTPGKTRVVAIAFAEIEDGYRLQSEAATRAQETLPYTAAEELASTVAHELAHACGVNHHGNREGAGPYTTLGAEQAPPRYRAFDVDGNELLQRPLVLGGAIGGPQSRASGDTACILTYNNLFQWVVVAERGVGYRWRALRPLKPGTIFCTGKDGAVPNEAFGEAGPAGGSCLAKLRVRDW